MSRAKNRRDSELEDTLVEAAATLGWLLEKGPDEANLEGNPTEEIPDSLLDPYAIFDGTAERTATPNRVPHGDFATEGHMARAARDGGEIPDEILARMKRDRDNAGQECDEE